MISRDFQLNISVRALMHEVLRSRSNHDLHWSKEELEELSRKAEREIDVSRIKDQASLVDKFDHWLSRQEHDRREWLYKTTAGMNLLKQVNPWKASDIRSSKNARAAKVKTAKRYARDHGRLTRFAA